MSGHENRRLLPVAAATTVALLVAALPASAHNHPTPIERAAPGVVFVEARANVEVALIEHRQKGDAFGVHIGVHQTTWNPVLASASGFVVDPNGAIVTSGDLTHQDLERAKVYAVNQAFYRQYGRAAPLPADPFSRHHIGKADDRNEQRLQACYADRPNDAGGCIIRANHDMRVYPYVTSQARYGNLSAEVLKGGTRDVAVLRVRGANAMPTVALGQSVADALALSVLGFTGVPGPGQPLQDVKQHLAKKGASVLKSTGLTAGDVKDAGLLKAALAHGFAGGPVVAERGQVVGLLPRPATGGGVPDFVPIGTVLSALKNANVTPHGGPVDNYYDAAMHPFKNGEYAASIPNFRNALGLFPGHYRASTNLAIAKQRAAAPGSAAPATTQVENTADTAATSSASRSWLWGLLLAAVLVLAAVAALLLRRRGPKGAVDRPTEGATALGSGGAGPGGNARPGGTAAAGGTARPATAIPLAAAPSSGHRADAPGRQEQSRAPRPSTSPSARQQAVQSSVAAPSQRAHTTPQPPAQASIARVAPERARFCTACGGRLATQHRYCGWCGEPVG